MVAASAAGSAPSASALSAARRWIAARLRALAEDWAAATPLDASWQAMVAVGEDGVEVYARRRSGAERLAKLGPGLGAEDAREIRRHLGRARSKAVVLRLGEGLAIAGVMALPASAGDVLPAIVANKVESLAPWPAGEALWGFRRRGAAKDVIEIDVAIAGRREVEAMVARLAAAGVKVSRIEAGAAAAGDGAIPLGGHGTGSAERILRRIKIAGAIAMIAAVAVAVPAGYALLRDLAALDDITVRSEQLQAELRARTEGAGASPLIQEARLLAERKAAETPFMTILETLTAALPDGTWLETLDYADGRITFAGKGTPTPQVIDALENSPTLAKVGFASATQRDAGAGVESFSITAAIEATGAKP